MVPYATKSRHIRRAWLATDEGVFARARMEDLLGKLLSGWPRRSRSMLVMNAGGGNILESLWQTGFDVTGQEDDPEFLALAGEGLSRPVELFVSAPDHMPYNDCFFDYAVAVAALEFWENPEAVLQELNRVACSGVAILFPNTLSLCATQRFFGKPHPLFQYPDASLPSPRAAWRLLRKAYGPKHMEWGSVLVGPCRTWKPGCLFTRLNSALLPLPFGAMLGVRVDFGSMCTGTPLLLRTGEPMASAK